jgi:hypothetical protein
VAASQRLDSGNPLKLSKLTFRRDGETYFLDSIRASGESYESRLPSGRSERKRRDATLLLAEIVSITEK